jgi:anti-anti-sigma factor
MQLDLTEEQLGTVNIVHVKGRLDAVSSPVLEQKLSQLIDGGATKLVLECANLGYMSSAGMRVLLLITKKLGGKGKLVVCGLQDEVLDIIKMAGFHTILEIRPTQQDALLAF